MLAFAILVAVVVTACSNAGSGLTGKTWQLTSITETAPAFQGVVPAADQANYTIEFKTGGTFDAKADCNMVGGSYTSTSSGGLTIVPGPSTLVACGAASLGQQYVAGLSAATSYAIANSQLTITQTDGGTLVFK
jgi:heat shock protein HslJ